MALARFVAAIKDAIAIIAPAARKPAAAPGSDQADRPPSFVVVSSGAAEIERGATYEQVIAGLREIIAQTRASGKGGQVAGSTIGPRPWSGTDEQRAAKEAVRGAVNEWIRGHAPGDGPDLDAVIDLDERGAYVVTPLPSRGRPERS